MASTVQDDADNAPTKASTQIARETPPAINAQRIATLPARCRRRQSLPGFGGRGRSLVSQWRPAPGNIRRVRNAASTHKITVNGYPPARPAFGARCRRPFGMPFTRPGIFGASQLILESRFWEAATPWWRKRLPLVALSADAAGT